MAGEIYKLFGDQILARRVIAYLIMQFAEKLGMGSRNYELVEILPAHETVKMEMSQEGFERQPSFY
jgi:hypothetical protein